MAKKGSKKEKPQPETEEKALIITTASIKERLCNYSIEVKRGAGVGTHVIKGPGIVSDDMELAFTRLNVHLACLDDAFSKAGIEDDIDFLHTHDITGDYTVTGFAIKGTAEDPKVILIGEKFSHTASGQIAMKTPEQCMMRGNYKFYNELRDAVDTAKREVEEYHNGKYTLPEKEGPEHDPKQMSILDQAEELEEGRV